MSHHPLFNDEEELNRQIWGMCPEVKVFVPKGIHCTPYALSSTAALAKVTIEAFKTRNVSLWEKHGATATGEDVEKAWDYLDVANNCSGNIKRFTAEYIGEVMSGVYCDKTGQSW